MPTVAAMMSSSSVARARVVVTSRRPTATATASVGLVKKWKNPYTSSSSAGGFCSRLLKQKQRRRGGRGFDVGTTTTRAALAGVETPWSPAGEDMDAVIDELTARAAAAAFYGDGEGDARVFIGVVGSPGSGKSTLAAEVCRRLNAAAGADVAVVFPMDGFHYYRAQLDEFPDPEEARRRRGSPFTFDAEAFVARVRDAKANRDVTTLVPAFDHEVHDPEEDAIAVTPSHKVVVVEGNYLLLPEEPWRQLYDGEDAILDETWFVDTSVVRREREREGSWEGGGDRRQRETAQMGARKRAPSHPAVKRKKTNEQNKKVFPGNNCASSSSQLTCHVSSVKCQQVSFTSALFAICSAKFFCEQLVIHAPRQPSTINR